MVLASAAACCYFGECMPEEPADAEVLNMDGKGEIRYGLQLLPRVYSEDESEAA